MPAFCKFTNLIYFNSSNYYFFFFKYFEYIGYIYNIKNNCIYLQNHKVIDYYNFYRIDDIQDNSVLRRGIPVAHNIYGVASTMNAANYAIFIALEKVLALNHVEVNVLCKNFYSFL